MPTSAPTERACGLQPCRKSQVFSHMDSFYVYYRNRGWWLAGGYSPEACRRRCIAYCMFHRGRRHLPVQVNYRCCCVPRILPLPASCATQGSMVYSVLLACINIFSQSCLRYCGSAKVPSANVTTTPTTTTRPTTTAKPIDPCSSRGYTNLTSKTRNIAYNDKGVCC